MAISTLLYVDKCSQIHFHEVKSKSQQSKGVERSANDGREWNGEKKERMKQRNSDEKSAKEEKMKGKSK